MSGFSFGSAIFEFASVGQLRGGVNVGSRSDLVEARLESPFPKSQKVSMEGVTLTPQGVILTPFHALLRRREKRLCVFIGLFEEIKVGIGIAHGDCLYPC
jgi:hypothetical protein